MLQFRIVAVAVVIKLGEYVVPDFDISVTFAAYGTVRTAAAVLLAAIIVNFGTWTAWTGSVLPEVVLFAETEYPLFGDTHLFIPDIKRLVILQINGRIKAVGIQSHHLGQEFP